MAKRKREAPKWHIQWRMDGDGRALCVVSTDGWLLERIEKFRWDAEAFCGDFTNPRCFQRRRRMRSFARSRCACSAT